MIKCKRCGECCRFEDGTDCKYLIRIRPGLTSCRIWGRNFGTVIGPNGQICTPRLPAGKLIKGCPLNEAIQKYQERVVK